MTATPRQSLFPLRPGALALLVGRNPEGVTVPGGQLDAMTGPHVARGLPFELSMRRPDAQRTVYIAREQMNQYKLARLQAVIGLCKALGGWLAAASNVTP